MSVTKLLLPLLLFSLTVQAETQRQKHGRLPDGRAYRIDNQGLQLVDHIAELELGMQDLQRQVQALENELEEKRSRIALLESGKCSATFKEIPLVENTPPPEQHDSRLADELAERNQLVQEKSELIGELQEQLAKLRDENARLAADNITLASAQQKLAMVTPVVAPSPTPPPPAALEPPVAKRLPTPPAAEERAMLAEEQRTAAQPSAPRSSASQQMLKQTIAEIDRLISKRKSLIDSLKGSKKGVTLQVQTLKTPAGTSLDSLRLAVSSLQPQDAERIRNDLSEIRRLLNEDIQLMTRLSQL